MASRLSRIFLTQPGRVLLNRRFYAIPPNPPRTEEEKRARISDDPTKRTRLDKIQEEVNTIMEHHFTDEDKILVPEESDVSVLSGTCFSCIYLSRFIFQCLTSQIDSSFKIIPMQYTSYASY